MRLLIYMCKYTLKFPHPVSNSEDDLEDYRHHRWLADRIETWPYIKECFGATNARPWGMSLFDHVGAPSVIHGIKSRRVTTIRLDAWRLKMTLKYPALELIRLSQYPSGVEIMSAVDHGRLLPQNKYFNLPDILHCALRWKPIKFGSMPNIVLLTNWERLDTKSNTKIWPTADLAIGEGVPYQQWLMNHSIDNPLPEECVYDWKGVSMDVFKDGSLWFPIDEDCDWYVVHSNHNSDIDFDKSHGHILDENLVTKSIEFILLLARLYDFHESFDSFLRVTGKEEPY
jgi:hypothetical protein